MRTSDLIWRVFSRACNDGDSHIMHSTHVFMVQSRLAGDEILPDLFLEGTSIYIYTREDRATRSARQPRLHSGLQIRVQEIPGIHALGDPSDSLSIDPSFSSTYVFNPAWCGTPRRIHTSRVRRECFPLAQNTLAIDQFVEWNVHEIAERKSTSW